MCRGIGQVFGPEKNPAQTYKMKEEDAVEHRGGDSTGFSGYCLTGPAHQQERPCKAPQNKKVHAVPCISFGQAVTPAYMVCLSMREIMRR